MSIKIESNKLLVDQQEIYRTDIKIYKAQQFNNDKIVVHIKSITNNLLCINKKGNILWIAQSISPKVYEPYQAFDIRNGKIYGGALTPSYGVSVELDPETGKILSENIDK